MRTTLIFGAHSSSRLLVAPVPCQLCHIDQSAAELPKPHPSDFFAPRSASMLHCTYLRVASTSPKIDRRPLLMLRFGAEAYGRRVTDKHSGINSSNDHRRGLRLLREPIGQHTPLLSEPDRPLPDPLGPRAPCSRSSVRGSFLVVPHGKEQAVLEGMFGLFCLATFLVHALTYGFQYIRRSVFRVGQVAASFLLKIVQLQIRRNLEPSLIFRDQQRSTAVRHVASTTIMFAAPPTTAQHNGLAVNTYHIPPGSLL